LIPLLNILNIFSIGSYLEIIMLAALTSSTVAAGFPSPADDFIEKELSIDELLIEQPAATLFVRVVGLSRLDLALLKIII